MSFDALTITALFIAVVTIGAIAVVNWRHQIRTDAQLREVARQAMLVTVDPEVRKLCQALRERYPRACPGLDYVVTKDAGGPAIIKQWYLDQPQPSTEEVKQILSS
jgi:hypothetical protein